MIDKIIIEIIVILIAGAGLFSVMTKFYLPEINYTFYGQNPFAVKRDIIDAVNTTIFTGLAFVGLAIQVVATIFGDKIKERLYGHGLYFLIFVVGFVLIYFTTIGLRKVGNYFARKEWKPKIIKSQIEGFDSSKYLIENNMLREDQLRVTDPTEIKKYQQINFNTVKKRLDQIEKLLELPKGSEDFKARIKRLEKNF